MSRHSNQHRKVGVLSVACLLLLVKSIASFRHLRSFKVTVSVLGRSLIKIHGGEVYENE